MPDPEQTRRPGPALPAGARRRAAALALSALLLAAADRLQETPALAGGAWVGGVALLLLAILPHGLAWRG